MATVSPYLLFGGNCREAFTFYHACLGGELQLQSYADSPMADHVPAEVRQGIMRGSLRTGSFTIMGFDAGRMDRVLTVGNNVALALICESDDEIETLFAQLGAGGTILDPLMRMGWGGKFGALTDRFGIRWLLSYDQAPAS
ncbi:MAG: VOC family protein [Janthinobacterium lividum]